MYITVHAVATFVLHALWVESTDHRLQEHTPTPPKMAQDGPKMAQDGPKMVQDAPKIAQGDPKMARDAPKVAQHSPKMAQHGRRWSQKLSDLKNIPARRNARSD